MTALLRSPQSKFGLILRALDGVVLVAGLQVFTDLPLHDSLLLSLSTVILLAIWAEFTALYHVKDVPLRHELRRLFLTWVQVCVVLLLLDRMLGMATALDGVRFGLWILATPIAMTIHRVMFRLALRWVRSRSYNLRYSAICPDNALAGRVANAILHRPEQGFRLLGIFPDGTRSDSVDSSVLHDSVHPGGYSTLLQLAREGRIQRIYLAHPLAESSRLREILDDFADTTCSVYLVPDFFTFNLLHARWGALGELSVVSIYDLPYGETDWYIKRVFDLLVSLSVLLALWPLLVVIGLLVRLESRGPAIFKQDRIGYSGRAFKLWKFRSMKVLENEGDLVQARRNDSRVTKLGAFLRRSSLDELPQLINVVQGHMSLVGPRPHAVGHNDKYRSLVPGYMLRHKVKPGITGLAQINGARGETDTIEKMETRVMWDLEYIRGWSIGLDITIIMRTVWHVLRGQNAY